MITQIYKFRQPVSDIQKPCTDVKIFVTQGCLKEVHDCYEKIHQEQPVELTCTKLVIPEDATADTIDLGALERMLTGMTVM